MDNIQIEKLALRPECFSLFDYINDVIFFIKSRDGKFLKVNTGFLNNLGFTDKSEVLGKTDHDLFKGSLADMYLQSDRQLLRGEIEVYHREEVVQKNGEICKSITTKFPLKGENGDINGVIGIARDVVDVREAKQCSSQLKAALDFIDDNLEEDIKVTDLARLSHMSDSTFLRAFKRNLGMTPKRYILVRKVKKVISMIKQSRQSFCEIAVNCGFSDQSHMSREFKRVTGMTPSQYNDRVREKALNQISEETFSTY